MSLGVLNNLSAVYAENNLNNTSNSLNTVLQQLSSGSKINSGADDAAGLSLVDGLQANQQALMQSQTNATEGVGLLQVADGALSQVTSLLNRAVTLATEASNGTLNSSQDSAANSEYQSILSEINNIGTTTTYNNQAVFGASSPVNIYTGDSSTAGASVDSLNIGALTSSNVGNTGGVMSYSSGQNNVFLNLSTSSANAALGDTLNSNGTTTMNVNYLVPGSDGNSTTATAQITVGGNSGYDNTVGGMISAINQSGLGLTATFATQAQAGVQGGGAETGIEISGGLVSAGVAPSASSTSGTLDLTGLAAGATLAQGATVTIGQGNESQTFTIGETNNTLATLAGVINGSTGATNTVTGAGSQTLGVTASVVTNGDGTQSLALASAAGGALSVSTHAGSTQAPSFAAGTTGTSVTIATQGTQVAGSQYIASAASSIVVGTAAGGETAADQLTVGSSITIKNTIANDNQTLTFIVGSGTDNTPSGTYYTDNVDSGSAGNTLGNLADAINAQTSTLGVYATVGASGLTITTGTAGTGSWAAGTYTGGTQTTLAGQNVSVTANNLTSATSNTALSLYAPTLGGAAGGGSPTITVLDTGHAAVVGDTLSGSFTLDDASSGTAQTFTMSGTDTWTTLMNEINSSNLGVNATFITNADGTAGHGGLQLTANANGVNPVTVAGAGITDGGNTIVKDASGTGVQAGVAGNTDATASTAILQLANGNITDGSSVLGGAVTINYNSGSQTFIMGSAPTSGAVANAIYTGGTTVTSLINAINSTGMNGVTNGLYSKDVVATDNSGGDGTGGIYLQGAVGVASQFTLTTINPDLGASSPLSVTSAISVGGSGTLTGNGSTAVTGQVGNNAVDNLTAENNLDVATAVNTNDTMSGNITVTNGSIVDTFKIGTGNDSYSAGTGTYYTNNTNTSIGTGLPGALENYGNTLAGLASLISAQSSTLGVTAQANASGLTLSQDATATHYTGAALSTSSNTLVDVTGGTYSTSTTSNQLASESDTLSGSLVFNVGSGSSKTVAMSDVAGAGFASTVQGLVSYINQNAGSLGISAAWNANTTGNTSFGNIQLISGTEGTSGTVTVNSGLTSLTDTTTGAALSYAAGSAYNIGLSSNNSAKVYDSTAGQSAPTGVLTNFASDQKSGSGIATISYSAGAGQSLSATDLSNQTDAQAVLKDLNSAITAVAAQDGYIGAQINTLNAVSSVLSTQQENVQSAQNAVQATDYASATSNMSKYEILSQTGISALAQANSMEQEVTKLLQ